jgi:CRP-like cAMP-binding protein
VQLPLIAHISRYVQLTEQAAGDIVSYFEPMQVPRKQNLLEEGRICRNHFFVSKGCLRMFFVNEKGAEQTIQFAIENWWLSDYASFSTRKPSEFYIQSVERSELMALSHAAQDEMLVKFPQMERYFHMIHQRAHAAAQFRIRALYSQSKEAMYQQFCEKHPEFVQRVPQYLLASFLGFTPEYLSELRRRRVS